MATRPGVDVGYIREQARKNLLDLLEGVRGGKNLVIERSLMGPIGVFCKASTLQDYGVDKFFVLENDNVDSSQRNIVFLAHGENAEQIIAITEQIKRLQMNKGIDHDISVFLVPRRTLVANKIFEDAGVLGDISIEELPLYFVPLEQDLLSLELEDSFRDLYLHKDPSTTFLAAKALMQIQYKHGLYPRILGKGDHAQRLMELLLRMRAEASAEESSTGVRLGLMPSSEIESLIVIDREVDFLTVLLTQLTYEGFIDELYGIKDNQAEIDISIVGSGPGSQSQGGAPQSSGTKRKILLSSEDKLYEQLRDANFARVGGMLQQTARRMQTDFGAGKVDAKQPISELKDLVRKLPGYQKDQQSLKTHIEITDDIGKHTRTETFRADLEIQQNLTQGADPTSQHDAIEELIARGTPLTTVLRLLCLESVSNGGVRQKDLDNFRTLIMHAYGHQHLLTLDRLEQMGLLNSRTGGFPGLPVGTSSIGAAQRTNYNYLRKALKLIVDEVDEVNPNDIAYVYSGYAPLSVRLVQCIVQKSQLFAQVNASKGSTSVNGVSSAVIGWQGFEDALKAVRGQTFNKVQKGEEAATKARSILSGSGGKKTVVVMFLGGITRTEVAALRFLNQANGSRRILICTSGIITGNKMIDAAMEKQTFALSSSEE